MERVERERLQAIVETAGAVCHEMNQPLMAISGYGELCLMDLDPGHPARELIQKALNQAERMGQITRKLTHVTSYKTKEYLNGKILDIDSASTRERDTGPTF
jgi:signal transduction histidine kinase